MGSSFTLETKEICKSFGEAQVLKGVNFTLKQGEIHALMGENGAGKSTLIKIICGDYSKDSGEIFMDGKPVSFSKTADSIHAGIRVIHQEINIVKTISVAENIFLGHPILKKSGMIDWDEMNKQAQKILDELGVHIAATTISGKLSIAEQQIVEIAKAISVEPKILIMDEPTAALNDQETQTLFNLLLEMKKRGVSIIYITHRFSELYIVDRVTVLRDGISVKTLDIKDVTDDLLIKYMIGEEGNATFIRRQHEVGDTIFRVEHLSSEGAFDDINIDIRKGELVTIFGLFGAGQTELCRALFGDFPISSGKIYLNEKQLAYKNVAEACKSGIGYVSDDRKIDGIIPMLSVKENMISAAMKDKFSKHGIIKDRESTNVAQKLFDKLKVKCQGIGQALGSLSGGNQQKVMICRWLANESKMIILNLPTRGVDVGARAEIYRTLEDLAEAGVGILMVSLEMSEVLCVSDRIYVMQEGKISAEYSREEATQEKLLRSAILSEKGVIND